jgi:hypothetical protein
MAKGSIDLNVVRGSLALGTRGFHLHNLAFRKTGSSQCFRPVSRQLEYSVRKPSRSAASSRLLAQALDYFDSISMLETCEVTRLHQSGLREEWRWVYPKGEPLRTTPITG